MPQDTSTNEGHPDHNIPYMRHRHEDFQLVEVEEILRYPDPSKIMTEAPTLPKGGEVYLYKPKALDRRVRDQYWWVNRGNNFHSKGQKRPSIMKTYFSLKDRNGSRKSDCLNGFRRHLYRLADAREDEANIFIHYLGDETLHQPKLHGNTRVSWYSKLSAPSSETAVTTPEEVSIVTAFEFPAVSTNTRQTSRYQNVMARNTSNNIGNKQGLTPVNARTTQSNVLSAKPGGSPLKETVRQGLDTNTRKRLISSNSSNHKTDTNKTVNNPHYLQNSDHLSKFAKVTINSTQNGQQVPPSRTGQPNRQPTSRAYIHQSISNPVVTRRQKISTPISSIDQRSRPQQTFVPNRQQVKPPGNQATNLIKNQNSLQQSARTAEQQQHIKMRNLSNSLSSVTRTKMPTSSQIILSDTIKPEPGKQNFISHNGQFVTRVQDRPENILPHSSNYIPQNSQPTTSGKGVSSSVEKSITDDSTLPLDYEKFFEEASKLPRMGCDVFVLVSYPGCKPAYWGTEKYVRKFKNSERLLPFSDSGCLSIRLSGVADKQNLLANNLDLPQPIHRQSDDPNSPANNLDTKIFIKEESRENCDNNPTVAQDAIKQEYPDVEDRHPLVSNRQARIQVLTQRPDDSSEVGNTGSQNNISLRGNDAYTKQLNTAIQYGNLIIPERRSNENTNGPSLRDNEVTNYYDTALVYKDDTSHYVENRFQPSSRIDKEHLSVEESTLRLESEIAEPSEVLIKIEPLTDDYGEVNSLVYTEYG